MTHNNAKSETLKSFFVFFLFCAWHVKSFSSKRAALKVDLEDRKIHCLQARQCIFLPGNFTDWDSEGVKLYYIIHMCVTVQVQYSTINMQGS